MAVKERVGTVVSDKMEKTVVVAVESRFPHPIYQKTVSRTTRYKAHDEDNTCRVGDRVRITETRPMSRHKRWTIAEVLSHSPKADKTDKAATPEAEAPPAEEVTP
ncbi:MAG: 30S ribosomal protein S17 [Synechococcus sp. BS301-5m-G54]|jgi:small subunit ribosomal protein S17|uniref:30S ribosomal protein S17 n=1 Tax=Synechococcales TaxID=1890424 RepID=UPI00003037CD|nr:30S ribosomal protein S17 [Synechococcus sp. KORDI-49]AII44836.1 30S ribosomal protein S17 [Synechococcus sp. KORDI-49]MBL6739823.1 30S ribosomal protein S17 [Synechococcus sp. BS301-5m-G54]MBL6795873.1 30S ribosomal protein S17 [Synechococcus sp. BS307-5m-G34]HCX54730.1 30S ribosomal protein S17 [Synechococcus sp. UBA9887]